MHNSKSGICDTYCVLTYVMWGKNYNVWTNQIDLKVEECQALKSNCRYTWLFFFQYSPWEWIFAARNKLSLLSQQTTAVTIL